MTRLSDRLDDYCFFDFETRALPGSGNGGDLKIAGTYRYAKNARPIILTYAIGEQPVECIDLYEPLDIDFSRLCYFFDRAASGKAWFVAWNTGFDRTIWNNSLFAKKPGLLRPEMALDAMAQATASNLPADLQSASKAIGGPGKRLDGKDLIRLFSLADGATPKSHPREWEDFKRYAVQDTQVLREVFRGTRALERFEWEEYWVSERINERGIAVDIPFCEAAYDVSQASTGWANRRLQELTGDPVMRITMVKRIADWVYDRLESSEARAILDAGPGVVADEADDTEDEPTKISLTRSRISRLLTFLAAHPDPNPKLVEVLELREYGGSSSPVKFRKIVEQADKGRLKNQYVFNGAMQTGRFSSRGVQIHNLPRASLGAGKDKTVNDELDVIELIQGRLQP
jgi:DNA polymerase